VVQDPRFRTTGWFICTDFYAQDYRWTNPAQQNQRSLDPRRLHKYSVFTIMPLPYFAFLHKYAAIHRRLLSKHAPRRGWLKLSSVVGTAIAYTLYLFSGGPV
jgi:hypothetical protein